MSRMADLAGWPDQARHLVREHVSNSVIERASEPIIAIDDELDSLFDAAISSPMPVVVVDANVIRNEFSYLARHPTVRTTLINAANARLLRLFAHEHVIEEVAEHIYEWADQLGIAHATVASWWATSYLPLLRVIPRSVELGEFLTADEAERVERLRALDPDDVPSATLSIVLGAFYLSEDAAAVEAVYGQAYDREKVAKWVDVLKAGSSSSEAARLRTAALLVPIAFTHSLSTIGRDLWRVHPALALGAGALLLGGATALAFKSTPEGRQMLGEGLLATAVVLGEFISFEEKALEEFHAACPRTPELSMLRDGTVSGAVLCRAALHTASRHRRVAFTAKELATQLPPLAVGRREQLVRNALRGCGAFRVVRRGSWALGYRYE